MYCSHALFLLSNASQLHYLLDYQSHECGAELLVQISQQQNRDMTWSQKVSHVQPVAGKHGQATNGDQTTSQGFARVTVVSLQVSVIVERIKKILDAEDPIGRNWIAV